MTPDFDTGTGTQCFDNCERKIDNLASLNKGRFAANDVGKAKPLRFSGKLPKTPVKIVPVSDVNSVCRVCFVGLCPGAAGSPCKCEKIVNVKHNLLNPSKEDTRGKLSSLLRSEVRQV